MAAPILDDRKVKEILAQLQALALTELPAWQPRAQGDAGTMLQRIFARLLELALHRLNEAPDKHLLAFLDTMGISLMPPAAARVPLTFMLLANTRPQLLAKGAQASGGQQARIIFETDGDLNIIPAQLTSGFTVDPNWDRYTDETLSLAGTSGFNPFVGTKPIPHVFYIGDTELLNFSRLTKVELSFATAASSQDLQDHFTAMLWQYRSQGTVKRADQIFIDPFSIIPFFYLSERIDEETIEGLGLPAGIKSRWLKATLTTPFADAVPLPGLQLNNLKLKVSATGLQPDIAFTNTAPLDVTKDFQPLGAKPTVGDAFYFASDEVFGKPGATVVVDIDLNTNPELSWEYLGFEAEVNFAWKKITTVIDNTNGFQRDGQIQLTGLSPVPAEVNNTPNLYWIRARVVEPRWLAVAEISSILFNNNAGLTALYFDDQKIDFSNPFAPFGTRPLSGQALYFGFKIAVPQTMTVRTRLKPTAKLEWQYLSDSWKAFDRRDITQLPAMSDLAVENLSFSGKVLLKLPPSAIPRKLVNGQESRWLRVRVVEGDYGKEAQYIPVNANDPSKGYKLAPGTGTITPPRLRSFKLSYEASAVPTILRQSGFYYQDLSQSNQNSEPLRFFLAVNDAALAPHDESAPACYFGFDQAFPEEAVHLYIAAAPRTLAGNLMREAEAHTASQLPPLSWQYFNGSDWRELTVIDATNNLTESGALEFLTPVDIAPLAKFDLTPRYWLRAQSAANDPFDTQRLTGVFLNTTSAVQAITVASETVASSNGLPSQRFQIARAPILPRPQVMVREPEPPSDQERLAILAEEGSDAIVTDAAAGSSEYWVRWHEVANFRQSDRRSRHYILDHITGEIVFGDGLQGLIPPRGNNNIVAGYRSGGGGAGNLPAAAINRVETPRPGVATVTNPIAAEGGAEAETVAMVVARGPQALRHRERAVAGNDLEWLARQAAGTSVARAKCLANINRSLRFEPGWVTLLIVPQGTATKLSPGPELIREVENYLEARAFAGTIEQTPAQINVIGPGYLRIAIAAEIVPVDIDAAQKVKQQALTALTGFLHPLTGGPNGDGWEFGRDLYISEVYQLLEGLAGVDHVKSLRLIPNSAQRRITFTEPLTANLDLPANTRVITTDGKKAALLAEPLSAGASIKQAAVKGFKEGDRITRVLDLKVGAIPQNRPGAIKVATIIGDKIGFPKGSLVTTADGKHQTRLKAAMPHTIYAIDEIVVADAGFAARLKPDDLITIFYPFPMTVTSVTLESGTQRLEIEPYGYEIAFPRHTLFATLDNLVRAPLVADIDKEPAARSLRLADFSSNDELCITTRNSGAPLRARIAAVGAVDDLVYLDENFLLYAGKHSITMVAD